MIYAGVDNGVSGGIVAYDSATRCVLVREPMPTINVGKGKAAKLIVDETAVFDLMAQLAAEHGPALFVMLEKAQAMPDQGVASVFVYGQGYGVWRATLAACARIYGMSWELAHPATWGKIVLNGIEGDNTKSRAVLKCQRALPALNLLANSRCRKPHTGLADAGCIAMFAEHVRPPESPIPMPPKRASKVS